MTIKIMYVTAVQWNLVLCIVLMSTSCIRAQDVVRCHCNDASCVSTSYMCKSTLGTCYTRLTTDGVTSDARAVHGCIDQLPVRHQELCVPPTAAAAVAAVAATTAATSQQQQQHDSIADGMSLQQRLQQSERSGEGASSSDGGADALKDHHQLMKDQLKLICCHEDMCNYMEGPDIINIYINTNDSQNKQHDRIEVPGNTQLHYPGPGSNDVTGSDGDLWFKAAVIAVPIAGGFILIMLVLLAVRLLRTDTQRHRHHLISMHNEQFYNQQYYQQQMYPNYPKYQMNYGGSGGGGKAGHGFYEPQYRDDLQQDHQVVVAGPQHLSTVPTRQQTAVNQIYTGGNKGRNSNKNSDLLLAGHSQEQHHPLSRPLFVSVGPVGDGGAPGVHMRRDGGGSGGLVSSVGGGGGRCAPGGYKRISTDTSDSSASIVTWKEALPNNADDSRLSQADDKQRSQTDDKQRSRPDDNQRSRPDDNRRSRADDNRRSRADDKQDAASVI